MRIRCPYCDCRYDIHPDTLGNPIGHERLGFGWWLRCYQCQKKFWLKSTTVINTGFSPIKADNRKTINKLSNFARKNNRRNKNKPTRTIYIVLLLLVVVVGVCYTHVNDINNFFVSKMRHFTAFAATNLQLSNIIYRTDKINGKYRVAVMGNIENKTNSIMSYNGVHIVLLNDNSEFASWTYVPDVKTVIPGDKVIFNTDRLLETLPNNIKVLVRIIQQ